MKLNLQKRNIGVLNAYLPLNEEDSEIDRKIKVGEIVKTVLLNEKDKRNLMHHRKYFALLNLVYDNLPEELTDSIRSKDELLIEIKMQIGHREKRTSLSGKEYYVPKSISFEKMGQTEFEKVYKDSLDVIVKYILTGTTSEELEQEVMAFM